MINVDWAQHTWQLRCDRSMVWPRTQTLIVADPHFGKAQHFRSAGVPVPSGTTRRNLDRLDAALADTAATRLIVLGDFFHHRQGVTSALLGQLRDWRDRWPELAVVNVRGNHDRQAGDPPMDLDIRCVAGPWRDEREPAVAFAHEPTTLSDAATLCGHVHPAVRLVGPAKSRIRAACFHFTQQLGVLPAFGAFTGMKVIRPAKQDRVFAVGPDVVVEVSARHEQIDSIV